MLIPADQSKGVRSRTPTRAAVIGAGLMGRWHADAAVRAGAKLAAVVDCQLRRAAQLARRYGGAQAFSELAPLLETGQADVVHICTPLESHQELATEVLRARLHTMVEKPLARTAEDTAELLRLALAQGVFLCPVHQFLFQAGVLQAQQCLGEIGPVLHLDFAICTAGTRNEKREARQELVAEILPHPLSLATRLLGKGLGSLTWQVHSPLPGELRTSGCDGRITVSLLLSTRGRPTTNHFRVIGERGTIHVDLFHGFMVREQPKVSRAHKIAHPFAWSGKTLISATTNLLSRTVRSEIAYPGLRELVRRFYHSVRQGTEPPISAQETLEVAVARDAILQQLESV